MGRSVPVIVLQVSFNRGLIFLAWADLLHTGAQYSAGAKHRAKAEVLSVCALAPHFDPASFLSSAFREANFPLNFWMWEANDRVLSSVTPRYSGY